MPSARWSAVLLVALLGCDAGTGRKADAPPPTVAAVVPAEQEAPPSRQEPLPEHATPPKHHAPPKKKAPSLNELVRDYAVGKLGKQVGDGECWALAYEALNAVNAKRPGEDGLKGYEFGKAVELTALLPGDILQFENINFKHTEPDGRWFSESFPHHTAIVASASGTKISYFEQNFNNVRTVRQATLDLKDRLPGGTLSAWRPLPR